MITAVAPLVWGSTYLVTSELLPDGRPLFAALTRSLPAGLLLVALTRCLPPPGWWTRSLILGTLNIGAFFALLFVAADRLPGGVAATVIATQPMIVAVLSVLLLGQHRSWRVLTAAAVGVAGVALVVLRSEAVIDPVGIAAAAGAALVMAVGVVLSRRWSPPAGVVAFAGWQLTAGGLVLTPVALVIEGPRPPALDAAAVAGLAYLGLIGAALTYVLWFRGIQRLGPTSVTFLGLLSPLVATALGWIALGQDLTAPQAAGFLVVLACVVVGQAAHAPPAHLAHRRRTSTRPHRRRRHDHEPPRP